MKKKGKGPTKLRLSMETLRNLAAHEIENAVGGVSRICQPTGLSVCACKTDPDCPLSAGTTC
jgi:hypothetical protein